MSRAEPSRAEVWTRHWASGSPHSCAGSYGDTYGGAFAEFWRAVLARTPAGARVLDLATGAGALPRLFLQLAPELPLEIDAVDLADVEPDWIAALPAGLLQRPRFHPRTRLEQLPFADGRFDLVVSQYGLEYASAPEAWQELRRVRARQGRTALVIHHADARPVALARIEIAHIDHLLAPNGLLAVAHAMAEPMARAATPLGVASLAADPGALNARRAFNRAQDELAARIGRGSDGADVLHETREAVARALQDARTHGLVDVAHTALAVIASSLADARLRLSELCDCALDAAGVAALCAELADDGSSQCLETLVDQGQLMGWTLCIEP